jgi:hypothetical protein
LGAKQSKEKTPLALVAIAQAAIDLVAIVVSA